jgi:phosphoglycerate dehydrogenase-like enzyme
MSEKPILLVTGQKVRGRFDELDDHAAVYWLGELSERELDKLLPDIDSIFVQTWWPDALDSERLSRMSNLRFVQSGMAGVNHIPFKHIGSSVLVSSNAGGFSAGVAEYGLALMLAAAKRVVRFDSLLKSGGYDASKNEGTLFGEIVPMKGSTLGILGYGGIGKAIGAMGSSLGMNVIAFSRHPSSDGGAQVFQGSDGLRRVLEKSDIAVISLPLSKLTIGLIGSEELSKMKEYAILVNIARAEIVDEKAIYDHLVKNPDFTYATDVWQIKRGKETYSSKYPFMRLQNFIGTPHVAGGSAAVTGEPARAAVENMVRHLRGEHPHNVVDPSEYV